MQKKEYKQFFYRTIQYYQDKNVIITTKNKLPMGETNTHSIIRSNGELIIKAPKLSTINLIKQFARTYSFNKNEKIALDRIIAN